VSLFAHLRIFAVYSRPDRPLDQQPVLVKEGFNLFAFLFGFFWALYHRLWKVMILILLFNIAIIYAGKIHALAPQSIGIIQMGFQLLVGLQASSWRQAKLVKKGYVLADISAADSLMRAEQRYFERLVVAA